MSVAPSTKQREAGSPKPARRTRPRLSLTHVLIAVVVILAFVLNLVVLQDQGATTLVAVADQTLTSGSVLDRASLRLVPVDSGFEGLSGLVTDADLARFDGWVLVRTIPSGGLLDRFALVEPGSSSGMRSMSLPVSVDHAAGGALVPGDRVDVISVVDGVASFVATDLEVISVAEGSTGAIGSISSYHVVVNVDARTALRLAEALDGRSMEIIRSTGAAAVEGVVDGP